MKIQFIQLFPAAGLNAKNLFYFLPLVILIGTYNH